MDITKKQFEIIAKNFANLNPCINCKKSSECKFVCDKYVSFGNMSDVLLEIKEKGEKQ